MHSKLYKATPENWIYLTVKKADWLTCLDQFAHEFCHHLIESPFENNIDKFGWLEEVFCEIAALQVIKQNIVIFKETTTYPELKNYSSVLENHLNSRLNKTNEDYNITLNEWINSEINFLTIDRYFREKNEFMAERLLSFFLKNPSIWNTIPLLGKIQVTNDMSLNELFKEWEKNNF